jgi:signal transduction histidine kinase
MEAKPAPSFDPCEPPAPAAAAPRASTPRARLVDETVIHDLKNPLTSILGNMRLIDEMIGATLDPRMRQRLVASIQSAEELNAMLGDLQQLLWIESGEFSQSRSASSVADMVKRLSAFGQERATGEGKTLEIVSNIDGLIVEGYVPQIQRALELLLTAAVRLSRSNPVRISAARHEPGDRLAFTFSYNGLRIPPGLANTLFALESASLQRDYGMRIDRSRGLVLVKQVAELQGGDAGYTAGEDGGSFYLIIDRVHAAASPGAAGCESVAARGLELP